MKILKLFTLAILLTAAGTTSSVIKTAFAQSITVSMAKDQGLVGEQPDGLLGIVNPPGSLEIRELVQKTNNARMDVYEESSRRQNVALITVKVLAGKNLREKTAPGHYIQHNGKWIKKGLLP